jgi:hypothetical protein
MMIGEFEQEAGARLKQMLVARQIPVRRDLPRQRSWLGSSWSR